MFLAAISSRVTALPPVMSDLKERALRLRKEADGIRQVAMSLSFDEDRELFLQHAAALEAEAACLEVSLKAYGERAHV